MNKIYRSKKLLLLWLLLWINKTKWVMRQRVPRLVNFPDWSWLLFTENKYSWISHANLTRCWSRSSIISSSTVFDLCSFCMSCDDSILNNNNYPWKSLNSIFIVKLNLLTISVTFSWFYKIKNIGDVAGWNRLKVLILVEISVQPSWKYYLITKL